MKPLKSFLLVLMLLFCGSAFAARACEPMLPFDHPNQNERFDGGFVHFNSNVTHEWAYYLCFPRRLDSDTARIVYVIAPRGTVAASAKAARYKALMDSPSQSSLADAMWALYVASPVSAAAKAALIADVRATSNYIVTLQ